MTVVDALRRAPSATRALIGLFDGRARSGAARAREPQVAKLREQFDDALAKVRSIDDDRILRRMRALIEAILRTNAFAPAAERSARLQDQQLARSGPAGAGAVARNLGL